MRVAIVGSHSTGKTTLLRMLAERLDVPVLSEIAREKIAESETLPHHMGPEGRGILQETILREQVLRETALGKFLSDRSVFDAVAYAFDTPAYENLFETAAKHFRERPYDRIFFLPIEFPLEGDGVRSEDEGYRKTVENELESVLKRSGAECVRISGTPDQRLSACLDSLKD